MSEKAKVLVGIQARSDSTRFPGKVFEKFNGVDMLLRIYHTCKNANPLPSMLDWMTYVLTHNGDDWTQGYCEEMGIAHRLGSRDDLLDRYYYSAKDLEAKFIIRITGDCPLVRPDIISQVVMGLGTVDYSSNTVFRSFPEGLDVQGCTFRALEWFHKNQKKEREHPFKMFDENACIRESFVRSGMTWRNVIDKTNPIWVSTSIDKPGDIERVERIEQHWRKTQRTG